MVLMAEKDELVLVHKDKWCDYCLYPPTRKPAQREDQVRGQKTKGSSAKRGQEPDHVIVPGCLVLVPADNHKTLSALQTSRISQKCIGCVKSGRPCRALLAICGPFDDDGPAWDVEDSKPRSKYAERQHSQVSDYGQHGRTGSPNDNDDIVVSPPSMAWMILKRIYTCVKRGPIHDTLPEFVKGTLPGFANALMSLDAASWNTFAEPSVAPTYEAATFYSLRTLLFALKSVPNLPPNVVEILTHGERSVKRLETWSHESASRDYEFALNLAQQAGFEAGPSSGEVTPGLAGLADVPSDPIGDIPAQHVGDDKSPSEEDRAIGVWQDPIDQALGTAPPKDTEAHESTEG